MNYKVRQANINDLREIMEVIDDAKRLFKEKGSTQWQDKDNYPNINTLMNDLQKNIVLVATDIDLIIGVCVISFQEEECYKNITQGKWLNDNKYAVIHRIAVRKGYYHMGVAHHLLDEAEDYVIKENVFDIKVDTHENNIIMQHLLESMRYSYTGVIYLLRETVLEKKRLAYQKVLGKRKNMMKAAFLIHGFLSDMTDYDIIIPALEERYDLVYQVVLPGHGPENDYDYNKFTKEATFKTLLEEFDKIQEKYEIIDVFGYSMGGALATCLSSIRVFNKLILLAPANKYFNPKSFISKTEFSMRSYISLEKSILKKSTDEQKAYKELIKATSSDINNGYSFALRKYLRTYIWKAYLEFKDIVLNCNKNLTEIKNPMLICYGTIDQLVPKSSVEYLYSICTNKNKKLKIYEGITHLMLNSKNNSPIIDDILQFIDE